MAITKIIPQNIVSTPEKGNQWSVQYMICTVEDKITTIRL